MRRLAPTCALLAILGVPTLASAQAAPAHVLEDAATFRATLATAWCNARLVTVGGEETVRFARSPSGLSFTAPEITEWSAADTTLPFALRMLAAALADGPLDDAVAALGFRLDPTNLGVEPMTATPDGADWVAVRLGNERASVLLDAGLGRLREIRIVAGGVAWVAAATEYSERGNGWFPTRVVVTADGDAAVEFVVLDLARTAEDLAPLAGPGQARPTDLRFPRIPL